MSPFAQPRHIYHSLPHSVFPKIGCQWAAPRRHSAHAFPLPAPCPRSEWGARARFRSRGPSLAPAVCVPTVCHCNCAGCVPTGGPCCVLVRAERHLPVAAAAGAAWRASLASRARAGFAGQSPASFARYLFSPFPHHELTSSFFFSLFLPFTIPPPPLLCYFFSERFLHRYPSPCSRFRPGLSPKKQQETRSCPVSTAISLNLRHS